MEQLNGIDSLIVLAETNKVPLHIGALFIYDPSTSASKSLAFTDVVSHISRVIDRSLPMLKARVEKLALNIDSPYWVIDKKFDINAHVDHITLAQPGCWETLYAQVGEFHSVPLNMQRPLWQAQFIEGLDSLQGVPKGSVALLLKIHHALADGKTAVKIFSALHSLSAEQDAPLIMQESDVDQNRYKSPGWIKAYSRAYWHAVTAPAKFIASVTEIAPKVLASKLITRASYRGIPKTALNNTPSNNRLIRHISLPLPKIKQLKEISGCTVNDIALCIISGALREYLQSQQALPEEGLHALIPVDVRVDDELASVGNQLSFINMNIACDIASADERLAFIHKATVAAKKETQRIGGGSFMSLANNTYSGLLAWMARQLIASKYIDRLPLITNTIITNVPGVPLPCYLRGARLVDYVGFGPLIPTVSLFHVVSSIDSHVNISFQTCGENVVNTLDYEAALKTSYYQLLKAFNIKKRL